MVSIKKTAKIFACLFLSACCVACAATALSACGKGDGNKKPSGDKTPGKTNWSAYDGVKIGYLSAQAYEDNGVEESAVTPTLSLATDEKAYMAVEFEIQAPENNDGSKYVTSEIEITPACAVSATVQEAPTADMSEKTKNDVTEIKTRYKVPETAGSVRTISIVVRLKALQGSDIYVKASFKGGDTMNEAADENGKDDGYGADDYEVFDEEKSEFVRVCPYVKTAEAEESGKIEYTDNITYGEKGQYGEYHYEVTGADSGTALIVPVMKDKKYITEIAENAFDGKGFSDVTLPTSVREVGNGAFNGCPITNLRADSYLLNSMDLTGVRSVTVLGEMSESYGSGIPAYAFRNSDKLVNVTISGNVSYIGAEAFKNCTGLTSLTIPDSVNTIEEYAFEGCTGLTNLAVPDGVTEINGYAFKDCANLSIINLPESLVKLGYAFGGCNKLLKTDGGVTYVDKWAIDCDEKLEEVTLRGNTVGIATGAFSYCNKIKSINLPNGVRSVGDRAFQKCALLEGEIKLPVGLKYLGEEAFVRCEKITKINIPDGVTELSYGTFAGCTALATVTGGKGVTHISGQTSGVANGKSGAFSGCSALSGLPVFESLKSIGDHAFGFCTSLQKLVIPKSVTYIARTAFFGCENLTVHCEASRQPESWNENWNVYYYETYYFEYRNIKYVPVEWGSKG